MPSHALESPIFTTTTAALIAQLFAALCFASFLHFLRLRLARLCCCPDPYSHPEALHSQVAARSAHSMTSYLSRLSPIPAFPEYTGPYKVGTLDVELPISELESPSPSPEESISTVQYRVFYPCEPDSKGKNITWIPAPQRGHVSAFFKFLGANSYLADLTSCVSSTSLADPG